MKAKTARKKIRHAEPAKQHTRVKAPTHPAVAPAKKEIMGPAVPEPQFVETTFATLDGPVEFVIKFPEPVVDVFEVVEIGVAGDEV
jgi:hypothetical protein